MSEGGEDMENGVQGKQTKFVLTVEPVAFLYVTAALVQAVVIQNLYLDKVCLVNHKLNASQCASHNKSEVSPEVDSIQKDVAQLNIYASLLENIPAIFCVLFLGPWSNQNGRKTLLVLPLVGHMLSVLLYIVVLLMPHWPAEYILLASSPIGFFGGSTTMFMACNSYISDISTSETRTSRISFLYTGFTVSFPVGFFLSIYLYRYGGYLAVFGTSMGLVLLALLYTVCFVLESRAPQRRPMAINEGQPEPPLEEEEEEGVFSNLWNCMKTTFQERPGHQRAIIVLLLGFMSFYVFCQVPSNITYLYVRRKFAWDEPEYATFAAVISSVAGFGSLVLLPLLSSYFGIGDCPLGMVALLARASTSVCYALASTPLMMYLGSTGVVLSTAISVVVRSMLSKAVPGDQLGQVFSVLASLESVVPLASTSIFNLVYEATLQSFTGTVYAVEAGCYVALVFLMAVVLFLERRQRPTTTPYEPLDATPTTADHVS